MPDSAEPHILKTKLHHPRLDEGRVVRARLVEAFKEHREACLTLISAPAGYGKSTLAAEWTAADPRPSAWICLDDSDNDLRVFVRYLVAALESMFPESCLLTSSVIEAPELPSIRGLAGQLANELDAIGEPLVLVLDDYHEIGLPAIHDLLSELLRHPPANVHWVITTRRDPPLPLASLRAGHQLSEVRFAELRFSKDETAALMRQLLDQPLSDAALSRIEEMSEGWVVGLQLVGLACRHRSDPEGFLLGLRGNIREVQDYLVAEVLSRETPEFRRCILKTSLVERFSASFCQEVCDGCEDCPLGGEGMMGKLADTGSFMIPLDAHGEWYRYHHLFRDLLRQQAEKELEAGNIAELNLRVSRWFENEGSIEEAISHALKAGDPAAAAAIVEAHRRRELGEDRWYVVDRWLRLLPKTLVWSRPGLLISKGHVAHCRFQLDKIPTIVEGVESLLGEEDKGSEIEAEIGYFRGILEYWSGEAQGARSHFEGVIAHPETLRYILGETELMLGLARCMCGEEAEAIEALGKRVREIDPAETYQYSRLVAGLVFIHLMSGNLPRARAEAQHLRQLAKENRIGNSEAWGAYLLGCAHLQALDLKAAAKNFSDVLEMRYVLETRAYFDAATGLALAQQLLGLSSEAASTLKKLEAFALELNDRQYLPLVYSSQARISLLRGDLSSAFESVSLISEPPSPAGLFMWLGVPPITKARVLIARGATGDLEQATGLLSEIRQGVESCRFTCQRIEIEVLDAILQEKLGCRMEALTALKSALALAEPGGFLRPFIEAGSAVVPLLEQLSEDAFAAKALSELGGCIELEKAAAARTQKPEQPLIDPLTNRELDVLELVAKRLYDKEIAERLSISPGTVKSHLKRIYRKLDVGNRRHAAERAQELGILGESS